MKLLGIYLESIRTAFGSLRAHRLRTILTTLGVAIGIFAITIIFTLVNSLNHNLNRNLSKLGNSVIFVSHFPWSGESFSNWQKYVRRPKVSFNEYLRLRKNLNYVEEIAYAVEIPRSQKVQYGGKEATGISLSCVTQGYTAINSIEMERGRPFTDLESDAGRPVCIIGYNVAQALFGDLSPLGRKIRLAGKKVQVIGVSAKAGTNAFGDSPDDMIYIPYGFGARIFDMDGRRMDKTILIKAQDPTRLGLVENQIVGQMRAARRLRPKTENDFAINRPEMLADVFSNATKYLWYGGLFISFFAVVVGGFGIGNIMFTTVKERTFEIGLQKALGARRGVILFQFLTESVLLCLLGGILGLLLNFGVAALMQAAINSMDVDFEVIISVSSIVFGVGLSLVIGLGSGLVPSLIASRMDPVESMRG